MGEVYVSGYGPARAGRVQGARSVSSSWPRHLAAQHSELAARDEELQILSGVAMGDQGEEPDEAAQRQVPASWAAPRGGLRDLIRATSQYRPIPPNPRASDQSEFYTPRAPVSLLLPSTRR